MSDFSAFMAQNKIKRENVKYVASKNFVDPKTGEPLEWELRQIDNREDDALKKLCTNPVKVVGRTNMTRQELDSSKYMGKLAAACTVFPDLNNKALQESYGVMGSDDLLKAMLSAGEYAEYCNKISEVNDFDIDLNDRVEEAKN